ncbi:hypothetical protein [Pedobacter deserti]|uniref:hypothetical protein n=1 Tax=Pedobacter deserti TaxID=2817382 RepID=UPI0021092CBC|nr:hypothetical protein [Pedobacter sp. SYSU D00382]
MDNHVKAALTASLECFTRVSGQESASLMDKLVGVFDMEAGFMEKVDAFDAAMDDYPAFEELRETYFDLLMINFFASDVKKLEEDYLDSPEWEAIEEQTLDRGTELLNLLLYINECHDEDIEPELGDFLKEFLLVEEDEFQDEFHIYEELISNQQLAESSVQDICRHASQIPETEEIKELFVSFMSFFLEPGGDLKLESEIEKYSENKIFDVAVYALIANFNK